MKIKYASIVNDKVLTSNGIYSGLTLADVNCNDGCGFAGVQEIWVDKFFVTNTELKTELGCSLYVSGSICRCRNHNLAVGGVDGSKHTWGLAGDITITSPNLKDDLKKAVVIASKHFNCVIYYPLNNFMHCDMRSAKKTMTMTLQGLVNGFKFDIV